ncbi:o-succinylbenzoate--CoA ligase [Haloechinothrix sp. LS1_15]|uniref:o-succinylbenzoate--CoA ligase n=1 Tax=Haloechinothrix sp. LS1_15 TaxID=2652248 RepID=UPI002944385A|nr:o-succinylbenzoate--CoA ligase [Haloechinothrix sp. LS1_15]MDV6012652.1 AMP-binding protein [Haloechinothrix sp. LS1_15]
MRVIQVDGGEQSVRVLVEALAAALDGGEPVLPLAANDPRAGATLRAMRPDEPVEDGTAAIVPTSGSTGTAKGVALSAHALASSARATHARLGGPGRWLLATPAHYIGGLQVLVRSLLANATPAVLDLGAGFDPETFAAAAAPVLRDDGPRYTALVPTQLGRILDAGGAALEAARAFDAILIGGAATPPTLRERAEQAGIRVVGAYGMSETAGGCVYDGVPLDGVRVHVAADGDQRIGMIALAGDVLADGYRADDEATRAAFRHGWFHTNDLGRLTADGRLEVLGRADDVINTGGVKVPAHTVEQALLAHSGVRQVCVLGVDDAVWGEIVAAAVVPADPAAPPAQDELVELAREAAGRAAAPKLVRLLDALPLLGPGKVDRAAVRAAIV